MFDKSVAAVKALIDATKKIVGRYRLGIPSMEAEGP